MKMKRNKVNSQLKIDGERERRNKHETFIDFLCHGIDACVRVYVSVCLQMKLI